MKTHSEKAQQSQTNATNVTLHLVILISLPKFLDQGDHDVSILDSGSYQVERMVDWAKNLMATDEQF